MPRLTEEKKYNVEVTNAYLTESKNKGTIGVALEFKCEEGTIDHVLWATPNTIDRTWETLELLGFTKKHAEDMDNLDKLAEITRGATCSITTERDEEYGLKVKWVNPVGAMRSRNPNTKKSLHALLNGNSITGLMSAPRSAQRPAEPPPNNPTPTDVPF
jgi:hypothetical protein